MLHDTALAAALVDRLLHHGEVYYLKGDRYRLRGKPRPSESPEAPESASGGDRVIATPSLNVASRGSYGLACSAATPRIPCSAPGSCPARPEHAHREPPQHPQEVAHFIREPERKMAH